MNLLKYDRRYLFLAMIILSALFYIIPVPAPTSTNPWEKTFVAAMDQVKPGDPVLVTLGSTYATWVSVEDAYVAAMKYLLFKRSAHVIFLGVANVDEVTLLDRLITRVGFKPENYGKDHVNFGYISGGAPMLAALGRDVPSILKMDIKGNPSDKLPIMTNLKTATDFKLIVGGWNVESVIGQLTEGYHVPTLWIAMAEYAAGASNYYRSGLIKGYTVDVPGALSLENLTGYPGEASMTVVDLNVCQIVVIVALILGNIAEFVFRRKQ